MFRRWRLSSLARVAVTPVQLPGREERLGEPPYEAMAPLVAALETVLLGEIDGPYALLGHSMGALVAVELARRLCADGRDPPQCLIVAGCRAPHVDRSSLPLHVLADEELVAKVRSRFGGIPDAVASHPELLRVILPTLRADLRLVETYRCGAHPPLKCPLLALGGSDDSQVPAADLSAWRIHTRGSFGMRLFPGGHFFAEGSDAVAAAIAEQLAASGQPEA